MPTVRDVPKNERRPLASRSIHMRTLYATTNYTLGFEYDDVSYKWKDRPELRPICAACEHSIRRRSGYGLAACDVTDYSTGLQVMLNYCPLDKFPGGDKELYNPDFKAPEDD